MHVRTVRHLALIAFAAMLFSGCAETKESFPLNYTLNASIPASFASKPVKSIDVGKITDSRSVDEPSLIITKDKGFVNRTASEYIAEKPIVEILEGAIDDALNKSNYSTDKQSPSYELYGNLVSLDLDTTSGLFSEEYRPKIMVKLYLKDTSNGQVVWNDIFIGRSKVKSHGSPEDFRTSCNLAIDDLAKQVVTSESLRQCFR